MKSWFSRLESNSVPVPTAVVPPLVESHPLTSPNEPCADMSATTKKTGYNNKGGSWGRGVRGLSLKDEWSEKGTESMTIKFLDKSESPSFGN